MTSLNDRIAAIEERLADSSLYADTGEVERLIGEQARLRQELAKVEEEWLARTTQQES